MDYATSHVEKEKEKECPWVFILTCDVCSPPPIHAHVGLGSGGGLVPMFNKWTDD